nr:unnamed protein product [Callosobruchus analis]
MLDGIVENLYELHSDNSLFILGVSFHHAQVPKGSDLPILSSSKNFYRPQQRGLAQKQPKLSPFAVPSLNLPDQRFTKQQGKAATQRKMRFQKTRELKKDAEEPSTVAVAETRFCEIAGDSGEMQKPRSYEQLTTAEKVAVQALYRLYNRGQFTV